MPNLNLQVVAGVPITLNWLKFGIGGNDLQVLRHAELDAVAPLGAAQLLDRELDGLLHQRGPVERRVGPQRLLAAVDEVDRRRRVDRVGAGAARGPPHDRLRVAALRALAVQHGLRARLVLAAVPLAGLRQEDVGAGDDRRLDARGEGLEGDLAAELDALRMGLGAGLLRRDLALEGELRLGGLGDRRGYGYRHRDRCDR